MLLLLVLRFSWALWRYFRFILHQRILRVSIRGGKIEERRGKEEKREAKKREEEEERRRKRGEGREEKEERRRKRGKGKRGEGREENEGKAEGKEEKEERSLILSQTFAPPLLRLPQTLSSAVPLELSRDTSPQTTNRVQVD